MGWISTIVNKKTPWLCFTDPRISLDPTLKTRGIEHRSPNRLDEVDMSRLLGGKNAKESQSSLEGLTSR